MADHPLVIDLVSDEDSTGDADTGAGGSSAASASAGGAGASASASSAGGAAAGASASASSAGGAAAGARSPPPSVVSAGAAPRRLRFLTWNLDGLEPAHLGARTAAAAREVVASGADLAALQELVPESAAPLAAALDAAGWDLVTAEGAAPYFVGLAMRRATMAVVRWEGASFPASAMGRHLLSAVAVHAPSGRVVAAMTAHLESTAVGAVARAAQMRIVHKALVRGGPPRSREEGAGASGGAGGGGGADSGAGAAPSGPAGLPPASFVIFGGDTNLRDKECPPGSLPPGVADAWEAAGSPPAAALTWDMRKNDNKPFPGGSKPALRFDRVWFRNVPGVAGTATGAAAAAATAAAATAAAAAAAAAAGIRLVAPGGAPPLVARAVRLIGTTRLPSPCRMFPSDHWGVLVDFEEESGGGDGGATGGGEAGGGWVRNVRRGAGDL
jgi:endonuclease/exonuclease/phosphatase family metal-dependent hydrolase